MQQELQHRDLQQAAKLQGRKESRLLRVLLTPLPLPELLECSAPVSPPFIHSLIQTFIKNVLYIRLSPFILMFSFTTVGGRYHYFRFQARN